jgi:O-antigen/teichoic acid export membrane protein
MWSGLQAAVQMGVALLSARWLGPGDRGDLVLATTVATLLLLVSSLGAGAASRVVLAEPGRWWAWSRYVRLAGLLTVPHLVLSGTLGILLLSHLATGDTSIYLPYLAFSATSLSAHLFREGLHGLGRHRTTIAIDVASAGVQLLLIAGAYRVGVLTTGVALYIGALCYAGSVVVQLAVGRAADVAGRGLPRVRATEWWHEAVKLVSISRFALVAALGQSFVINGDRLLLGGVGTSAQVGIYAAASSFAQLTWTAPVALTALLTQRTAAEGTLDTWRRMHMPVLALTAVVAVVVGVLGWLAIPVLLGDEFVSARTVLPILCIAAVPYASYHLDSAACAGLRDMQTGALGALLGCGALVAATTTGYFLTGTVGVAYGVLITYLLMAVTARLRLSGKRHRHTSSAAGVRWT